VAEGQKQSVILESEAQKQRQINTAAGEAEAILLRAEASAQSISLIADSIKAKGASAQDAISLSIADKYVNAFGNLAKEGTTVIVPADVGNAAGMVTSILKTFDTIKKS
jgi:regulator of protease activity HflC (stomatin/prohibitin superfamily)